MGFIELVDFDEKFGGSFIDNSHFKKWYKKGFLEVLDFMLVNSCVAWNMSAEIKGIIRDLVKNAEWRVYVPENKLDWVNQMFETDSVPRPPQEQNLVEQPIPFSWANFVWCVVCELKTSMWKNFGIQHNGHL